MNVILFPALFILCVAIIVSSICRVNRLNATKDDKFSWVVMYTAYGCVAAVLVLDILVNSVKDVDDVLTTGEWFALLAISLNLWLTRKSWDTGVPRITKKKD